MFCQCSANISCYDNSAETVSQKLCLKADSQMNENLLSINENPLHTILLNQKKKKKIQSNFRIPVSGPKL